MVRVREWLRGAMQRALDSPLVPYPVKDRIRWRRDEYTWIARRPDGFMGKVRWKMLKDRRPLLTTFADKVAVREYVAQAAGREVLTECYAVVDDPAELDPSSLPREFVAKTNHGCGGMWVVSDGPQPPEPEPHTRTVFSAPHTLDWDAFTAAFRTWLKPTSQYVEWAYRNIPPRLLVEELLKRPDGQVADDYKLFVFNGRVRILHVDVDRFTAHRRRIYLPDGTQLFDVGLIFPTDTEPVPLPPTLPRMVEVAEALGRETDFVRVDLYNLDGRVVFGELTNYPGAGTLGTWTPLSFEREVGSWWTLPRRY